MLPCPCPLLLYNLYYDICSCNHFISMSCISIRRLCPLSGLRRPSGGDLYGGFSGNKPLALNQLSSSYSSTLESYIGDPFARSSPANSPAALLLPASAAITDVQGHLSCAAVRALRRDPETPGRPRAASSRGNGVPLRNLPLLQTTTDPANQGMPTYDRPRHRRSQDIEGST